jgi:hypothetical protein
LAFFITTMRELQINNTLPEPIENNVIEFIPEDNTLTNSLASDFIAGITRNYHDPLWTDSNALQQRCIKYFNRVKDRGDAPTITGLSLFLGYCSRQSLYHMESNSLYPLVCYTIKKAKQIIENWYEYGLHDNKRVTGSIFALKNMGWYDNQKIDIGLNDVIKAPRMSTEEINSIAEQISKKI